MRQKQKRGGLYLGLLSVLVGICLLALVSTQAKAATGINSQVSFNGKLVNTNGTNIADGTYNLEFKVYNGGTATGGGTLAWTEDRLVSASNGVTVSGGTFQVNLGSVTGLPSSLFTNDTLYLSIQVGNTSSCTVTTTFTANCGGDGEMTPYIRFTSTPYAYTANQLVATNGTNSTTLSFAAPTVSGQTITIPNATGTLCLQSSVACGFAPTTGGTGYIWNGSSAQTASFNITGAGVAGTLQASSFDQAAAGALNVGSSTATSLVVGGTGGSFTTTKVQAGTTNLTIGTNSTILFGPNSASAFVVQNSLAAAILTVDSSAGKLVVGNGANTINLNTTFDTTNGLYAGTSRPTKKIVLTAEYPGSILDAANDASCSAANTGAMTSAFTGVATPAAIESFYKWTTTSASAQCYDIVVRLPIPSDFSAWNGAPTIKGLSSDGVAAINVEARDTTGTVDGTAYGALAVGTNTWTTVNLSSFAGTYTAGGTMTLRIRVTSTNNNYAEVGTITLPYYSKF